MTDERLAEIRARCEAATTGPWDGIHYCQDDAPGHCCCHCGPAGSYPVAWCYAHVQHRRANIDFIAHAREDVPALLAEVERLRDGRLTPGEFQNLCHHLHERGTPCTRKEFEQGCRDFQDTLFGPTEDDRGEPAAGPAD